MANGRRSVLLLIDIEPDARKTRRGANGWEGSKEARLDLEELRQRLQDKTKASVQFSWFLRSDPQIAQTWGKAQWAAVECPEIFSTIEDHGDYCGIHPHLWRWDSQRREWFNEL